MSDVTELITVREHLETTATLFEDLSEALSRVETRLEDIEKNLNNAAVGDSTGLVSMTSSDTSDLRATVISLRQHLDTALSSEIGPLTDSLKYLQSSGIPELLEKTKELNIAVSSLHQNIPKMSNSVESLLANISPLKKDTEAAGKFARFFQEPMRELLGRNAEGGYDEHKFMLRNFAQEFFALTGRDESGKQKPELKGGKLHLFLENYFKKNYRNHDGLELTRGSKILETFLDYFAQNFWHRIFDLIILVILYWGFIAPVTSTIKSLQDASKATTALVTWPSVATTPETKK